MPYYGLYVPTKKDANTSPLNLVDTNGLNQTYPKGSRGSGNFVFNDKKAAFERLKKYKDARLRTFELADDAVKYAETGYEVVNTKYPEDKAATIVSENSAFRSLSSSQLTQFRMMIERSEYEDVKSLIWENPRYLVSSGDTPTIHKEGYRYNSMHICAIKNEPLIAELILRTVSDIRFAELLTGKKDEDLCRKICRNLLDYYLNITEKGRNETPLHLAAKYGHIEMVELLISYPQCKMIRNKKNALPSDVICTRMNSSQYLNGTDCTVAEKIRKLLLEEPYYVPVLRSSDNSVPPQVGEPFLLDKPPNLKGNMFSPEFKIEALAGPMEKENAKDFCRRWKTPPRFSNEKNVALRDRSLTSPVLPYLETTPINMPSYKRSFHTANGRKEWSRRALFDTSKNCSVMDKENGNDSTINKPIMLLTETEKNNNIPPKAHSLCLNSDIVEKKHSLFYTYREQHTLSPIPVFDTSDNDNDEDLENSPIHLENTEFKKPINLCPSKQLMTEKMDLFFNYREQINFSPLPNLENMDWNNSAENSFSLDQSKNENQHTNSSSHLTDSHIPGLKERHIKITDTEKGLECIGRELAEFQKIPWREYWDFLDIFIDLKSSAGLKMLELYFRRRAKKLQMEENTITAPNMESIKNALDKLLEKMYAHDQTPATSATEQTTNLSNARKPNLCVEKSLQVYAKRIAKVIYNPHFYDKQMHESLEYELKRLKTLVSSFKDDVRFQQVDFSKVHSRMAHLVASLLLELNKEKNISITKQHFEKLMESIYNEHVKCFRVQMLQALECAKMCNSAEEEEDVCIAQWKCENSCNCDWDLSLSRKTSRRQRYKSNNNKIQVPVEAQQSDAKMEEYDSEDSDKEFMDCLDDESMLNTGGDNKKDNDEEDDVFLTPPEDSRLFMELDIKKPRDYQLFVYGNEPTKRDLDVLAAICDSDVSEHIYVSKWKEELLKYTFEEMSGFPSPTIIKKSEMNLICPGHATLPNEIEFMSTTPIKHNSIFLDTYESKPNMRKRLTPKLSPSEIVTSRISVPVSPIHCSSASAIPTAIIKAKLVERKHRREEFNNILRTSSPIDFSIFN